MTKLKANLNPRYTDSATAQMTTGVRKSFKKLFSFTSSETPTPITSSAAPVTSSHNGATEFAALASTLSQSQNKDKDNSSADSSPRSTPTPQSNNPTLAKIGTLAQNENIRSSVLLVNKKAVKKYKDIIKDTESQQLSQLKALNKGLDSMRKKEKKEMVKEQEEERLKSKSATTSALSEETEKRIAASREARVDRELDKRFDKKRDDETKRISEEKKIKLKKSLDKLVAKSGDKYAKLFIKMR